MTSVFDRLRSGEVVKINDQKKGRLNLKDKTLETSDGRRMFVGDDPDFFPQNEKELLYSREKESNEKDAAKYGQFGFQFANQGLMGSALDIKNKITLPADDYLRRVQAKSQVSGRISEESPWTSAAATAASFVPDIALTRGMSAFKAAPLLTGLHSGSRVFDEPLEVGKEALMSAAGGKILDIGANKVAEIAKRRGASRAMPVQQEAVRAQNEAGSLAVEQKNASDIQNFNTQKAGVKQQNEKILEDFKNDLTARQNEIIKNNNDFEVKRGARNAEVLRRKNLADTAKAQRASNQAQLDAEYQAELNLAKAENKRSEELIKLQNKQYNEDLKKLPELQKKAQQEYSSGVIKNAEDISNAFPKESKIYSTQIGAKEFADEAIKRNGLLGSAEGSKANRIINSIFPEGEVLTAKSIAGRYRALEDAIQKSSPQVQGVLNDFKAHISDRLPQILADNVSYTKVIPQLKKQITSEVEKAIKSLGIKGSALGSESYFMNKAKKNLEGIFNDITPENFMKNFQNGEMRRKFLEKVMGVDDFVVSLEGLYMKSGKKKELLPSSQQIIGSKTNSQFHREHEKFLQYLTPKLDAALAKADLKMIATDLDAAKKVGGKLGKTIGVAPPVSPPEPPSAFTPKPLPEAPTPFAEVPPPVMPPDVMRTPTPQMPQNPSYLPEPSRPTPQSFIPQPEPSLAPPSGFSEQAGDLLEKNLLGGKDLLNNPFTKLGALKYVLGKGALPLEAAYVGAKTLTSPTQGGEMLRKGSKLAGIQAIDQIAQQYPSYRNGIIENPMERRSLTKEIEDNPDLSLEQKAMMQSKVNRGKPLDSRL